MSITARAGDTFYASVTDGQTGLAGTIGVQITSVNGAVIAARTTTGITETPSGSGVYTAALTAPDVAADYVIVWDDGAPTPTYASEGLHVTAHTDDQLATDPDITPSQDDVAKLCGAYTREYVGGYEQQAGRELGSFTTSTTPTAAQVDQFIAAAVVEVRARLGYPLLLEDAPLAKTAATWHAVSQVEAKRLPAGTEDAQGAHQAFLGNFAACMSELQTQAKRRLWFVG